jgi:alpha-tubulin suppressor-like RCC1 family protein
MPLTKVEAHNIDNYAVSTEKLSNTAVAAFAQTLTPKISAVIETDNAYTALDDTAMNTAGGYIVVTGSDFQSGATVIVDTVTATSTTFVDSTTLRALVPAKTAGTYNVFVVNPDGGTAIRVNGLTYSDFPAFTGSASISAGANTSFNVSISAPSDSTITYSNTSALPAGTTLLANGYFYGNVTVGVETVYSFTVKATDVELQDTSRTYSLTVSLRVTAGLYAWGNNSNGGALGLNDTVLRSSPVQVGTGTTWSKISTSWYGSAATKTDGTLWSWGVNQYGQGGFNDRVNRSSPTQVGILTNWSLVSLGKYSVVAIKTDGTLWSWGSNSQGGLGSNSVVYRSSPVQVGALTNWSKISNQGGLVASVKTDGTLWSWGRASYGGLGLNDVVNRSSPVQIGAGTTWSLVSVGTYSCIATKTDGTLWVWGTNANGESGLNNVADTSSPVQVGTGTTWLNVQGGGYAKYAIKTDGSLWSMGKNNNGQLGLNDVVARSSPVQVGTESWNLLTAAPASAYCAMAVKTNGTLWAWGKNQYGQGGVGNVTSRSSPTQIGTAANWTQISGNFISSLAIAT